MRKREFTAVERSEIIAAYVAGATVAGLSERHDTGWTQIAAVLRQEGVYEGRDRSNRRIQAKEVARRYQAGESLGQLSKAYGRSNVWVLNILKALDIDRRPAGSQVPAYVAHLRELREQGMGARNIAKTLGIGITTAQKWIRRMGMSAPSGAAGVGPEHQAWRGGTGTLAGYRFVWLPKDDPLHSMAWKSGYMPEHRLVMARSVGRPLDRRETVHHINGDTTDNRLENLQLRQGAHGKGSRFTCLDCGSHNVAAVRL